MVMERAPTGAMPPQLTRSQLLSLAADGYCCLRSAVPPEMVRAARRAVNASMGRDGIRNDSPDRTSSGNTRVRGHFDALGQTPVILDLLRESNVQPLVHPNPSLIGHSFG